MRHLLHPITFSLQQQHGWDNNSRRHSSQDKPAHTQTHNRKDKVFYSKYCCVQNSLSGGPVKCLLLELTSWSPIS